MNMESFKIATFLLIVCFANQSLADRRDGIIGLFASVHSAARMDYKSEVGSFSVVRADVHLYPRAQIATHVIVDEGVTLWNKAIVLSHVRIEKNAEIGNKTTCEQFTHVGPSAVIGDAAILKQDSVVMSHGKIGQNAVVGHYSHIGRKAEMEENACVAQHVQIGSRAVLGAYSVVQSFVVVPSGLKIRPKQIVINAPETDIMLRALRSRQYSRRFFKAVNEMAAKSDTRFARHFSRELGYVLSDLNKDCKGIQDFIPQVLYLFYSYLQKMHGEKKMDKLMQPAAVVIINYGKIKVEVNDCDNALRYSKIFDEETVNKFLVTLALYEDYTRQNRIKDEKFCMIAKQVLSKKRSILAINHKCGGTTRAVCNGCGDGETTTGSYSVSESDATITAE